MIPSGFSRARAEHLLALERDHFWFAARLSLLGRKLRLLSAQGRRVIELGCGTGAFASHAMALGFEVTAVEGHEILRDSAAARGVNVVLADLNEQTPLPSGSFDVCCVLDVLEHVEPTLLLAEAHRLLVPGGRLLVSVPAHAWLWGPLDAEAGHRCRYSLEMLEGELARGGFRLTGHTYYQFLLLPLVWASRRLTRATTTSLERRPPRLMSSLLAAVNRIEVDWLSGVSLPTGSSIIAWAVRE